jgi:hypothetical protein
MAVYWNGGLPALSEAPSPASNGASPEARLLRGAWNEDEDAALRRAVDRLGVKDWIKIAQFVGTRTSKQCRERWFHQLAPDLKKGRWESWEDRLIMEKHKELGNRWAMIADLLPGRSAGCVKNRWNSALRTSAEIGQELVAQTMRFGLSLDQDEFDSG